MLITAPRGWSGMERSRPAREVDIRYGHGLLRSESEQWPRYLVVATKRAWQAAEPYLAATPAGVGIIDWLDRDHLEEVALGLPDNTELLIGIGGGTALDGSKYVALRKEVPLVLVPTIISTGAIIHGLFPYWKGHEPVFPASNWPFCDCEYVLVDYDLALEAPAHLHTAGLGDILCGFGGISEWRYRAERGEVPEAYADQVEPVLAFYDDLAFRFPATLSRDGNLTAASIKLTMTAIQERDDRSLQSPHAPGADHVIHHTIERICDRSLVHGEMTALGSVVTAWATGQCEEHLERLDRCRVRYRPTEIGLTKEEFRRSLEALPGDLAERGMDSILGRGPVVDSRFNELWRFLEGS